MSVFRALAVALLLLARATSAAQSGVTPLQKVMEMLDDMTAKGKQAKHEEEVEFNAFHQWCVSLWDEKKKSIKEAAEQIEQLTADIEKAESDAEELRGEIEELDAAIAKAEKELAEAKAIRAKEKADYDAQHQDFSESIDALEHAIQVLKSREADVPQSLTQLRNAPWMPTQAKSVLASFLEFSAEAQSGQAPPEANAYEFQSGGVIAVMEKLRHKFQDQLLQLQKEEMNQKANFEELAQGLEDNIEYDTKTVKTKTARRAERLEDAAKAKGDLEVTKKTKADDEQILEDTLVECDARSKEYEQNQVLRKEELEAIAKAYDILASPEVSGNAEKYLPKLIQKATSLAQLSGKPSKDAEFRKKAAAYLQMRAKKLGSQYLSMMAVRVTEDPFAKVKQMIKDLIVKLMEESNAEADHNAFCSAELATNKQTRENKAASVEELAATSEKLTADIALLKEEIAKLGDDIAAIMAEQEEATKLRAEEKAVNTQTMADAKDGQQAVERAIKVLRDFYTRAEGAALIQEPYKGMQDLKGGIIGLLEVCLSDFARLETETTMAEQDSQSAYEKYMAESTQSKEVKEVEKEHKEGNQADAETDLRNTKKELAKTKEELDAALEYFEKLKADCIDTGLSYEERVRAREEEIQSLQEALKILQGEDIA